MIENSALFENLQRLASSRLLCVGDVMLDRFVYGAIERISPEAPIPVLLVEREKHMLGGSGNVAANAAAVGSRVTLIAVVGDDTAGQDIQKQLGAIGVDARLVTAPNRLTTVKSRFVCGGQQMLRVDREKSETLSADLEQQVIALIEKTLPDVDAIILSDYKKGLLTDTVVSQAIVLAKRLGKPVIVDPKGSSFARYAGASYITPNRKELETATGMKAATDEDVRAAAMKLIVSCHVDTVLATRGKEGMSVIMADTDPVHIPANVREVYDVSGAGDTVIAVFAAAIAAKIPPRNAAQLANIAAGIVVGKPGTAIVRPDEIEKVIEEGYAPEKHLPHHPQKVANIQAAAEQAERWKVRGFKVGFTNGCFDLLHPGHLSTLRQAKQACDYLVVGLNSDASVRRLKGPSRPVQDETARAALMAALDMVDLVVVFDADTPIDLIRAVKPDVLIKGGQYKLEEVVGYDVVMAYGGKIVRAEMEDGFSTTSTIAKINSP